jgi:NADH dehydrogenase (ubiquinone) flavoprotein 1
MQFSTKRQYGGLKDQDRIFTNLYKDGDPFIDGALKRVSGGSVRDSEHLNMDPNFQIIG